MDADRIEVEISRRIRGRHELAEIGSNMSKAKHLAAASALSELLGWIRREDQRDDDIDREAEGGRAT